MKKKALIVVTSHDQLGNTKEKTGWDLSEVSHVYYPLMDGGFTIDFASPRGGNAPLDEASAARDDSKNKKFLKDLSISNGLPTMAMSSVDPGDYQLVYFAGGHGTMWDFPENKEIQRFTSTIYENGGIVAAVCHGPAALVNVKLSNGKYLIEGKDVNSFTDAEEKEVGKEKVVPFLLESKLRQRGANFLGGANWANKVVIDERLITGQNPQSATSLGEAIVETFDNLARVGRFTKDQSQERTKGT